jgi:hypothetical protein
MITGGDHARIKEDLNLVYRVLGNHLANTCLQTDDLINILFPTDFQLKTCLPGVTPQSQTFNQCPQFLNDQLSPSRQWPFGAMYQPQSVSRPIVAP